MKFGLHYRDIGNSNGPNKLVANLIKGLQRINVEYAVNQICEINGCLQSWAPLFQQLPPTTICGPNLVVHPSDNPRIFQKFKRIILPSDWTKLMYECYPETSGCDFKIWSVGIDTEVYTPQQDKEIDCLVYYKNRTKSELQGVLDLLNEKNQTHALVSYGSYKEEVFIGLLKKCRYGILLTGTESQGIAYMEILSSNLPCFVLDKAVFDVGKGSFSATSVPYFDATCGEISSYGSFDMVNDFKVFLDNVEKYKPREYILKNHTLEKSAAKYVQLLEDIK